MSFGLRLLIEAVLVLALLGPFAWLVRCYGSQLRWRRSPTRSSRCFPHSPSGSLAGSLPHCGPPCYVHPPRHFLPR